jgi:hypothetical protein
VLANTTKLNRTLGKARDMDLSVTMLRDEHDEHVT